jgi:hypothetical protein
MQRQLLINRLSDEYLCRDIAGVIKEFCFETTRNAAIVNESKRIKRLTNTIVENMDKWGHDSESETWGVGINSWSSRAGSDYAYSVYVTITGTNCRDCGEYHNIPAEHKFTRDFEIDPMICCHCFDEYETQADEEDYDF